MFWYLFVLHWKRDQMTWRSSCTYGIKGKMDECLLYLQMCKQMCKRLLYFLFFHHIHSTFVNWTKWIKLKTMSFQTTWWGTCCRCFVEKNNLTMSLKFCSNRTYFVYHCHNAQTLWYLDLRSLLMILDSSGLTGDLIGLFSFVSPHWFGI